MKRIIPLSLLLLFFGCEQSEDEVRAIVRDEMAKASDVQHITDANVIGPYSPAVKVGNFLFVAGQIGMNPETLQLPGPDIESQTRQALENVKSILMKADYDSSHVIQCTVYLRNMNDFQRMNLIYGGYFADGRYPARTTVEVSNLPRQAVIEVAAIAYKSKTL